MGKRRSKNRAIVYNYTKEASGLDIMFKIFKLYIENEKRGIASHEGVLKQQNRDICKREQG